MNEKRYRIAIHGGAGNLQNHQFSAELVNQYKSSLHDCIKKASDLLAKGGTALDAVTLAVQTLEDDPLYNAGKGSVLTNNGIHEMDASIMNGIDKSAGSVCAICHTKNPILLCREVMNTEFVMLQGVEADKLAEERGLQVMSNSWFTTNFRLSQLRDLKDSRKTQLDHTPKEDKYGTVGAVAIDHAGNLAAATSTGGMTNKRYGRVGDSAIIGCGTYASNDSCAVSCTGWGEYFIRNTMASRIAGRMEFADQTLEESVLHTMTELKQMGGDGGVIAIDHLGSLIIDFNTPGMYRAWKKEEGEIQTAIFK